MLRRYILIAVALPTLLLTAFLVTEGTWNFNRDHPEASFAGRYYTAQAHSMLGGTSSVAPIDLPGECFVVKDTCYGYFGITPSLFRLPYLFLFNAHRGMTPYFLFAALSLALLGSLLLVGETWRQLESSIVSSAHENYQLALIGVVAVVVGPATLMWQVSRPAIYEEAIAWAAALTIVETWLFVRWLRLRTFPSLAGLLLCAVLAANARPTGALPPIVLGAVIAIIALRQKAKLHLSQLLVAFAIIFAPVMTMGTVFYAKFNTPLPSLTLNQQIPEAPWWESIMTINGGHGSSLQFAPTSLLAYLRPDSLSITWDQGLEVEPLRPTHEPLTYVPPLRPGGAYVEPVTSITALASAACILTLIALIVPVFRRTTATPSSDGVGLFAFGRRTPWITGAVILANAAGLALTVTTVGISNRYLGDFWPCLVAGSCFGTAALARLSDTKKEARLILLLVLGTATGLSGLLNLLLVGHVYTA